MKKTLLSYLCVIAFAPAIAQDGELDPTFNTIGILTLGPGPVHDNINDLGIQEDQKIIGFGMTMGAGAFNFDVAITRLNTDGTLDTDFATDGYFTMDFNAESDFIYSGLVLEDGSLLACGAASITVDDTDILLVKLNPDGTPDNTFGGGDGIVIQELNTGQDYAQSMVVLADGSIVIAGSTAIPGMTTTRGLIMKFNADGSLNTDFGTNGHTVINLNNETDAFYGLVELADGSFVAAGTTSYSFATHLWAAKFSADGEQDTSFANEGNYVYEDAITSAYDMALKGSTIVTCGTISGSEDDIFLLGLTSDGATDATFGTDGMIVQDINPADVGNEIMILEDGRMVVVGSTGQSFFARNFLAIRFDEAGVLDETFAEMGVMEYSVSNDFDVASSVVLQDDGKLVLGGLRSGNDNDMTFMRLTGTGAGNFVEGFSPSAILNVYPNPATENFKIQLPQKSVVMSIQIFDATGKCVMSKSQGMSNSMDVSGLEQGIYNLAVESTNGEYFSGKLVVSKP